MLSNQPVNAILPHTRKEKKELRVLIPHCLCGLCGEFAKLISCRISHTPENISSRSPVRRITAYRRML